jgi:hypothetical protein
VWLAVRAIARGNAVIFDQGRTAAMMTTSSRHHREWWAWPETLPAGQRAAGNSSSVGCVTFAATCSSSICGDGSWVGRRGLEAWGR